MTPEQRTALGAKLEQMRAELESVTGSLDSASQPVELDQTRMGRLTRMDAMQAQAMAKASQHRQTAQLRAVGLALASLENDEYGICVSCDKSIAFARLMFDPTATLCIECASAAEL